MTLDETRQMGIEFERKVQMSDPNAILINKLDTETIYAFLNEYQKLYIKQLYLSEDQFEQGTRLSTKTQDILKTMIKCQTLVPLVQGTSYSLKVYYVNLPKDYYSYIRSVSIVNSTYKGSCDNKAVQNILIKHQDANKLLESAYDSNKILRNTYALLHLGYVEGDDAQLFIYADSFTSLNKIDLYYYKKPSEFSILTNTACELPIECFEDIVSGAYQLYMIEKQGKPIEQNIEQPKKDKE